MDSSNTDRELTRFFGQPSGDNRDEQNKVNDEFPNVIGSNQEATESERVSFTRKELLDKFVEVEQPPQSLITNLKDNKVIGLGKHMLSDYTIRPVACDKNPFSITHINPYNKAQLNRQ